jgi:hypothetical protein
LLLRRHATSRGPVRCRREAMCNVAGILRSCSASGNRSRRDASDGVLITHAAHRYKCRTSRARSRLTLDPRPPRP